MYLNLNGLSGFKLSSYKDEPPLQPGDPPASGSNLLQPPIGPPVLQQQPASAPFDFASFMRESSMNTTT